MSYNEMLTIGRKFGYDNIVQLQNLKRAYKGGKLGEIKTTCEIPTKLFSELMGKYNPAGDSYIPSEIAKQFVPKVYSDNAKGIISFIINRFTPKSYILALNSVIKNDGEILASISAKCARNSSGYKLKVSGGVPESNIKYNVNWALSNGLHKVGLAEKFKMLLGTKYSENGDVAKMSINYGKPNTMNSFSNEIEGPTALFDKAVEQISEGEFKNVGNFLDFTKNTFQ